MFLLTGARGQAGQAVIDMALKTNRRVKAIARSRRFPFADRIELLTADLRQLARYAPFLEDVEGFIHLAAARKNTLRDDVFEDLRILAKLLKHWHQGNFIFASSQIVYSLGNLPHREDSPCSPVGWYAAGKLMSEQLIQAHFNTCTTAWKLNHHWVSFRIPPIFYRSQARSPQFLDDYVRAARKGRIFYWECTEEQARAVGSSWVGERDLANALLDSLAIEQSGIFNIDSGYLRWIDLIESLIRKLNSKSRIAFQGSKGVRMPHFDTRLDGSKWRMAAPGAGPSQECLEEIVDEYLFRSKV